MAVGVALEVMMEHRTHRQRGIVQPGGRECRVDAARLMSSPANRRLVEAAVDLFVEMYGPAMEELGRR